MTCNHLRQIWAGKKLPCATCWKGGPSFYLPVVETPPSYWSADADINELAASNIKPAKFTLAKVDGHGQKVWV